MIIKPSRGGGGKGMRVVRAEKEFLAALAASRREARAAFGDDVVVLERFVERPRHVEVQVLADTGGHVVHLLRARVLDPAPPPEGGRGDAEPGPRPRAAPRASATAGVAAARAASYVNAGTVEFLLDPSGAFYFLEMNTRLQVEHPVTECVTGLDLVRLQIEVAAGRPLALAQDAISARGHALECRLYAEDPWNGDLPSPGRILHFAAPDGPGVRFDGGSRGRLRGHRPLRSAAGEGRHLGSHARPRASSGWRTRSRRTVVLGVVTNLERLQAIVDHPAFRARRPAHRVPRRAPRRRSSAAPVRRPEALAAAGCRRSPPARARRDRVAHACPDPWETLGAWRLRLMRLVCGDETIDDRGAATGATRRRSPWTAQALGLHVEEVAPGMFVCRQGDRRETFHCVRDGDVVHLFWRGRDVPAGGGDGERAARRAPARARAGWRRRCRGR